MTFTGTFRGAFLWVKYARKDKFFTRVYLWLGFCFIWCVLIARLNEHRWLGVWCLPCSLTAITKRKRSKKFANVPSARNYMKRLATKAICSVGVILGVVFGIDSNLATCEQGLSHIANLGSAEHWPTNVVLMYGLSG